MSDEWVDGEVVLETTAETEWDLIPPFSEISMIVIRGLVESARQPLLNHMIQQALARQEHPPLIVFADDHLEIEALDEDLMREHGWVRA